MLVRHIISIVILPLNALVVIPSFLLYAFDELPLFSQDMILIYTGMSFILAGMLWAILSFKIYALTLEGTAAPWDLPTRLVQTGPYRLVRNPVTLGVCFILFGEALLFQSSSLFIYLLVFSLGKHIYFIYSEEPGLKRRFGTEYELYLTNVPRWLPRIPKNLNRIV